MMRVVVLIVSVYAAAMNLPSICRADEPASLLLDFARPMDRIVRGSIPVEGKWKHYITLPKEPGKTIQHPGHGIFVRGL